MPRHSVEPTSVSQHVLKHSLQASLSWTAFQLNVQEHLQINVQGHQLKGIKATLDVKAHVRITSKNRHCQHPLEIAANWNRTSIMAEILQLQCGCILPTLGLNRNVSISPSGQKQGKGNMRWQASGQETRHNMHDKIKTCNELFWPQQAMTHAACAVLPCEATHVQFQLSGTDTTTLPYVDPPERFMLNLALWSHT